MHSINSEPRKFRHIDAEWVRANFGYDPDTGEFWSITNKPVTFHRRRQKRTTYIFVYIEGKTWPVHRLAYAHFHGEIDNTLVIDHLDRVGTNNRIKNFKLCTDEENRSRVNNPPEHNFPPKPTMFDRLSGIPKGTLSTLRGADRPHVLKVAQRIGPEFMISPQLYLGNNLSGVMVYRLEFEGDAL